MSISDWILFEFPDKDELIPARHQFHQALQNIGCIGRSYLDDVPGDINANLEWDENLKRLASRWIEAEMTFRSSFSLGEFSVLLVDELFHTISAFPLQGKKQNDVMVWLEEEIDVLGLKSSDLSLELPYEIPDYPTARGEAFNVSSELAGKEFEAWFHNANLVLRGITNGLDEASEVRCWPHHFDIASLITLQDTGDPETSKSINIGMSPGDDNYDEPYFYVSPWPYPVEELPDISNTGGFWHEDNWIGAILRASDISHLSTAEQQFAVITGFFQKTIPITRSLLGE
ncbi:MAG: hypothetical protein JXQ96_05575 [Cyclobacteriaceae bacterium]